VSPGRPAILAVDGGNSKADALLVDRSGSVLAAARHAAPANVGRANGSVDSLAAVIRVVARDSGVDLGARPVAPVGVYCLAGADSSGDERRIERALAGRGWTARNVIRNDTHAVLWTGTDRGWGVALVCGAGMNCLGVGPTGREVRFAALGELSGDLAAGGEWVGLAALGAAVRARDGRGPRTVLEQTVPQHFGMSRPEAVARAMYDERLSRDRLVELPPTVFRAAASGDAVSRGILDRVADEVVTMVAATIARLHVTGRDVDVVLGGGMFRSGDQAFLDRVRSGIEAVAPRAHITTLALPPVVGAALLGLHEIGAGRRAQVRLREAVENSADAFGARSSSFSPEPVSSREV